MRLIGRVESSEIPQATLNGGDLLCAFQVALLVPAYGATRWFIPFLKIDRQFKKGSGYAIFQYAVNRDISPAADAGFDGFLSS